MFDDDPTSLDHLGPSRDATQGLEAATAKDDEGLTPLCLAAKQGSGRMAAVLAAAGFQAGQR